MENLIDAFRELFKESCEYLNSQPHINREWMRIVRNNDGSISIQKKIRPDYTRMITPLWEYFDKVQNNVFSNICDILRHESKYRDVIFVDAAGKPIEDEEMQRYWLRNILLSIFNRYIGKTDNIQFEEKAFTEIYNDFEASIKSDYITVTEVSPLNVEMESDFVQIDSEIAIRKLSDEEFEKWLNADMLFSMRQLSLNEIFWLKSVLEFTYRQKRHENNVLVDRNRSRILTAIHLISDEYPMLELIQKCSSSFTDFGIQNISFGRIVRTFNHSVKISKLQESALVKLYQDLGNSINLGIIGLALQRWNSSGDRLTEEDKFIDYWIALESLYTPDSTQELRYRAALRIAIFLGTNDTERNRIYEEMTGSYDLRSEIVHGSIKKRKRKFADSELFNLTRSYLRQSLLKILKSEGPFDTKELDRFLLSK